MDQPVPARRALMRAVPIAAVSAFALASCGSEQRPRARDQERALAATAPESVAGAIARAKLAQLPRGIDAQLRPYTADVHSEAWAVGLALTGEVDVIERWISTSYGGEDRLPSADAETLTLPRRLQQAVEGITITRDWRWEDVAVIGTPVRRVVLVDPERPRTVRLDLSARLEWL